jgi:hypothetical protein
LAIDESSEREKYVSRKMKRSSGLLTQQLDSLEQANAANPKLLTCCNCGKTGHIAPQCPEPKRQQENLASTGRQRGEHKGGRGRGKNFRKSHGQAKGKNTQQANVSQSQHDTVVHGCSARVINLSLT